MKIGVDIDGVLNNIGELQMSCGSKFDFEIQGNGIVDPTLYRPKEIFRWDDDTTYQFWLQYYIKSIREEPARAMASEVLYKLKNDGHQIFIISSRDEWALSKEDEPHLQEYTEEWLSKHDIPYDRLILRMKDKRTYCVQNGVDIMIEDKPDTIMEVSKSVPVLCFDARYNIDCKGDNIHRVYSWYEIYRIIEEM